jgi:hypothetical protein
MTFRWKASLSLAALLGFASAADANDSPYTGQEQRGIKAL